MNSLTFQFVLQLIVWGIGLVQFILALYVFILNTRHPANRHISALFLLFSINSFALGVLLGAESIGEATLPAIILAPTSAIAGIAILLTAIILIKPNWMVALSLVGLPTGNSSLCDKPGLSGSPTSMLRWLQTTS